MCRSMTWAVVRMGFGDKGEVGAVVADGDVDTLADGREVGVGVGASPGFDFGGGDFFGVKVDE